MSHLNFMEKLLDGVEVEWKTLEEVAEYSPTRLDAAELDATSFVGVDNLVADKGGRVDASYLPNTTRLTAYEPLKNGRFFGKDYFRELLERVRSIRASERRIYQQITDIFADCSKVWGVRFKI